MKRTGILCMLAALLMLISACAKKPKAEPEPAVPAETPQAAVQEAGAGAEQAEPDGGKGAEYVLSDERLLPG